ncbi:MAG: site-specific DNA-methyltransferase [Chloroflexi bacterium]|nr:MAG: site-specific DNA-methyltransferase [Chloroflexota bacterium]
MTNQHAEPVAKTSADINEERIAQLRRLFPEAFTEGKVDFDKLRATLGDLVDNRPERYSFTWAGKQDAIRILQTPTSATLIPAPEESVDWNNTQNLFIEGDNLEVLKLLYKAYFGRVKMIYIDPPYNTGKDFIYPDNYRDPLDTYLQLTGQKDAEGNLLTTNSDTSGRYHSAWLTMMYPRLFLARQLLREDGMIFVSIDDAEQHHLKILMDEIFGEENFLGLIVWQHSIQPKGYLGKFSVHHNFVLCYGKTSQTKIQALPRTEEHNRNYSNPDNDPNGPWRSGDVRNALFRPNLIYDIKTPSGKVIKPPKNGWRWSKETLQEKIESGEIVFNQDETRIIRKIYLKNLTGRTPETIWFGKTVGTTRDGNSELKSLFNDAPPFDTPKPTKLLKRILELSTNTSSEDIVLDFFAGSCPMAQALLEKNRQDNGNRRYILVQLPEPIDETLPAGKNARGFNLNNIAEIGKERIRRVIQKLKAEDDGKLPMETRDTPEDLGFKVFKLAPSNFRAWSGSPDATPEEFASQMALFTDPLVDGWQPNDVIYEVAIKEGYSLNCTVQRTAVAGHEVYRIHDQEKDQHFYLCLENSITENLPAKLDLTPDDLFVCRDAALDDTLAANLALQCRLKTI